ncbi:Acetylcholine receptor subunit beta-like 1 [Hypsibius exemplaris]|uniref:Acetylcholine receptor subunit beta-like 1 n=1 Tax=Hypsibius exemplaris TaxID=2072580 RepID=A0A1W0WF52_HYPEX|nr:Acetylcholine receptor subunit beta-like 1 [Hypsibius exemplaris]
MLGQLANIDLFMFPLLRRRHLEDVDCFPCCCENAAGSIARVSITLTSGKNWRCTCAGSTGLRQEDHVGTGNGGLLRFLVLSQFLAQTLGYSQRGSAEDHAALIRAKYTGYNTLVRPVTNLSDPVRISFGIVLILIISVNERDQVFKSNLWYRLGWNDPQLAWNPSEYGNIQKITMPADKVWTPDIVLLNNADGKYGVSYKSNAVIYSGGDVIWLPPTIYRSTCEINVVYFPFDTQTCKMRFKSWTWNAQEVVLESFEDPNLVDLSDYTESGTWDIIEAVGHPFYYYTDKQPRMEMVYHFVIRRRPLFYVVNLLIPTCLITFLTVLVFYLPTDSGEKVALSISISVTLVFFLLLVSKILPPSKDLPLMSRYLLFAFIMNFISVLVTVCVIHMHYRSPKTDHAPPRFIQFLFFTLLPTVLLMKRPKRYHRMNQFSLRSFSVVSGLHRKSNSPQRSPHRRSTAFFQDEELLNCPEAGSPRIRSPNNLELPLNIARSESMTSDLLNPTPEETEQKSLVFDALDIITDAYKKRDYVRLIEEDWKWVASVIDRGLLWIFFIITSAGSVGILMNEQELFEYVRRVR